MDFIKYIAYFFIGMIIGGIILFFSLKSARKQFENTIESNDAEWNEKNEDEWNQENEE